MNGKLPDVRVRDEGTIVLFRAESEDGSEWLLDHLEGPVMFGPWFAVAHRMAQPILEGLWIDGLDVVR